MVLAGLPLACIRCASAAFDSVNFWAIRWTDRVRRVLRMLQRDPDLGRWNFTAGTDDQ